MQIETLNRIIDRISPDCHPIKRAMLIKRALEHRELRLKIDRANWFIVVSRPSEDRDFYNMVDYSRLSACFV